MVPERLRCADHGSDRGLGGDRAGRACLGRGPDGIGQDPRGIPVGAGPVGVPPGHCGHQGGLRLAPQSARRRHRTQSAGTADRHPGGRRASRRAAGPDHRRRPQRRHHRTRASRVAAHPAGHPHHHPRVALPDADQLGPCDAHQRADDDHRRNPRGGRNQARQPLGAQCGAAGRPGRQGRPTGGVVSHRTSGRASRPVPRRRPTRPGDLPADAQAVGRHRPPPGGRHHPTRPGTRQRATRRPTAGRARHRHLGGGRRNQPIAVAAHRTADLPDRHPGTLDADLHQLSPDSRAADRTAERAVGRRTRPRHAGRGARPAAGTDHGAFRHRPRRAGRDRPRPPRLGQQTGTRRDRGGAEVR